MSEAETEREREARARAKSVTYSLVAAAGSFGPENDNKGECWKRSPLLQRQVELQLARRRGREGGREAPGRWPCWPEEEETAEREGVRVKTQQP